MSDRRNMKTRLLFVLLSITVLGFAKEAQDLSGGSALHWKQFTLTIADAKKVVIYFGTPRRRDKDPKPSERTLMIDGFEFYAAACDVPGEFAAKLTALVGDFGSFSEYRGMKLCGGFHPDLCIEWQFEQNGQHWHKRAFACLGCHEWRLLDSMSAVHTDMTKAAADEIARISKALKIEDTK